MLPVHGPGRLSLGDDAVLFGVWHGPAYGVRSFLCVIGPLRVPTATGSPINPIAVL